MNQSRRKFIQSTGAAAGALAFPSLSLSQNSKGKRPNILYLCSDQQHWQAQGSVDPFFDTPHQDALSAESMVFENAFCTTPQCSPSRSSMLTGFYPHTTEMLNNANSLGGTDLDLPTIGIENYLRNRLIHASTVPVKRKTDHEGPFVKPGRGLSPCSAAGGSSLRSTRP